ncbi:MAG: hypothetical protein ACYTEE_11350 [Planctomycetota bacterium]|jgi:hypothetical protein
MKKLVIVDGDYRVGVYIDGKLHKESDYLTISDVLRLLEIEHEYLFADMDWMFDRRTSKLPENLDEVKLEK